ncbi:TPA: hypothetical protein N0F65_002260 [Lagenidium giganteum]|uniref:Coiled-coil domain-containing protein 103 n=1 Tax=Lagenidium giganteum TaxID=4803 RepID=A0AAV2YQ94_9STRA|nr:TPA: hypothetical protein N0F65_002260 [Lagenidium giganteum]
MGKGGGEKMTSIEHGAFDTAALEKELAQALEDDRKYKLTDSMKKRAIHTAKNYDEFKNFVACADLKPLTQKELSGLAYGERRPNLAYKRKPRESYGQKLELTKPATLSDPPKSAIEFQRNWRRHLKTNEAKYSYIQLTTPTRLGELFQSDIDADLMIDILQVMLQHYQLEGLSNQGSTSCSVACLEALEAFTTIDRFALIYSFCDKNQRAVIEELIALLHTTYDNDNDAKAKLASIRDKCP